MDPFEWDDDKNLANMAKHGVSFEAVIGFSTPPWSKPWMSDSVTESAGPSRSALPRGAFSWWSRRCAGKPAALYRRR